MASLALYQIIDAVAIVVVAVFGLMAGSFLNVVIYRVPKKKSVVLPSSHCPVCNHPLAIKDNIPIISFLLARGKCRYCDGRVSIQYPIIEAMTAVVFVILFVDFGLTPNFAFALFFFGVLLTVSVIDIQYKIIPNVVILPAIAVSFLLVLISVITKIGRMPFIDQSNWIFSIAGFFIGGGFLFLLALLWPDGMGGGDIKLAAFMGLFLGRYIIIALFIGFLLGSVGGLGAVALLGKSRKDLIPFGPYLACGTVLTWYFGVSLAHWYLSISGLG